MYKRQILDRIAPYRLDVYKRQVQERLQLSLMGFGQVAPHSDRVGNGATYVETINFLGRWVIDLLLRTIDL